MKTRILASIIIGGILATSAAQAESAFSSRDLDVIYSGFNPSFTRDVDVSNYYRAPANLQKVAATANKSACHWIAVKNGPNSINGAYPVANVESNYLASRNLQLVC
jgi:hypothetical protein